ncbi:MAG: ABC transporter ATP-binding protein/permease [Oscillospiraceae bacterium]|nr:ABC transporter ATP-binding protein/permease [Oscillospiraceae bacterium]MCL2247637.1 ABC transporter ATP-binding protein/permease [Oscillospiraceae bacterium]
MLGLFRQARLGKLNVFLLLVFIIFQMGGTLLLPTLTANIINYGVVMEDMDYVFSTGALMIGVAVLTGLFSILSTWYGTEVATRFAKNTRKRLFDHTQKLSYQDYKKFSTSSLITRATNDIEQLQNTLAMCFDMLVPVPFVVIIGMMLAFSRDGYMALIVFVSSFLMVAVFAIVAKRVLPIFSKVQLGLDKVNDTVKQYITGIRVVRAFNRTKLETERMDESFSSYAKLNIKINRVFAVIMPLITLFFSICSVAIVWFGGHRIQTGDMQIGDITAIIEYSMNILMYLVMGVFAVVMLPRAIVCAQRVKEVLEHRPEIKDGKASVRNGSKLCLEFKNVGFRYHDAENPVLHNINFTCEEGTTTAIIGGTGSGKSTIARMIPRLLDATSGQILLNGVNIKELSQEEERRHIGFVPQKAFLFSGTIADNLRHGNENATLRDMKRAAIVAQADDFINEMPDKYEHIVAQGGRNLSGGQRQRVSIARMLVKEPDVYVFDDSFSALDFKTDAALRMALKGVTQNAIVINIAQRISTIRDCDQIIVLDEGKIVGKGKHEQLMQDCDVYREIAFSQLSEEELKG